MIVLKSLEGFVETAGERRHIRQLFGRQIVDVLVERLTRIYSILYTVEAGHQQSGKG